MKTWTIHPIRSPILVIFTCLIILTIRMVLPFNRAPSEVEKIIYIQDGGKDTNIIPPGVVDDSIHAAPHGVMDSPKGMPARNPHQQSSLLAPEDLEMFGDGYSQQEDPLFLQYIRQRHLLGPSKRPYQLNKDLKDYSQMGQAGYVLDLLANRKSGFFVECGGAEGEEFSNTLSLEKHHGWSGLLVEANPFLFEKLVSKNRKAYSINACLSITNSSGKLHFKAAGLWGGLDGTMGKEHLSNKKKASGFKKDILVDCFTLTSIMGAIGLNHIDYFSLDVEGPELDILKTIDYHKLIIDVIGIEYRISDGQKEYPEKSIEKLNSFRDFFKKTGLYKEAGILPNDMSANVTYREGYGLDVFFKRIDV